MNIVRPKCSTRRIEWALIHSLTTECNWPLEVLIHSPKHSKGGCSSSQQLLRSNGGQPRKTSKETLKPQYQIPVHSIQVHINFWLETTAVFLEDFSGMISWPSVSWINTPRTCFTEVCKLETHTYCRWLSSCSNYDRVAEGKTRVSGHTGKQFVQMWGNDTTKVDIVTTP